MLCGMTPLPALGALLLVVVVLVAALTAAARQRRAVERRHAAAGALARGLAVERRGEVVVVLDPSGRVLRLDDDRAVDLRDADGTLVGSALLMRGADPDELAAERLASNDLLMGVPNRRHFCELMRRELLRASRYGRHLTLIAIRIDRLDAVVDAHGHEAGDALLRAVAATAVADLRATDSLGRTGEDAFGVCLPETDAAQAAVVAARLRERIADIEVPAGEESLRVTASLAICGVGPGDVHDVEQLMADAERVLARAEARGGDRVERSVEEAACAG